MIAFSTLKFTLRFPDGRTENLAVDSERVIVGSGAHAEIRLPREHADAEVLLVSAQSGAVFAQARSMHPPPMLNGLPFTEGRLLPDSVIIIGQVALSIELVQATTHGNLSGKSQKSGSTTYAVAALMMVAGGYLFIDESVAESEELVIPKAPALWQANVKADCPHNTATAALAFANEQLLIAKGKHERAPFHFEDGVAAVKLFDLSATCFERGNELEYAKQARAAATLLRGQMSEEFHVHRVRLEHALAEENLTGARTEIQLLLDFLRGRNDPYVTFLSNLDRKLELKFSGKKDKS